MKTIEEKCNEYVAPIVEAHAECRWCDAGELEDYLKAAFEAGARTERHELLRCSDLSNYTELQAGGNASN